MGLRKASYFLSDINQIRAKPIITDENGTAQEVDAVTSIAARGIQLVPTALADSLEVRDAMFRKRSWDMHGSTAYAN